jgi:outer membrane protein OmpA-like peptidoglycan-associated protein
MLALVGSGVIFSAQSHDPKSPIPLGSGINKGNVDNKENGPNYYYFYAGPGQIEMHYAFQEMGVFGNPFKQSLSFDLYQEDGTLIVHSAIVSLGKMEKLSQPGNLGSRHRLMLRVISPNATLRLGGYFEIEATGAVAFDGKTTGEGAKPESTELYRPASLSAEGGSLYEPGASLYTPVGALMNVEETPKELRLTLAADILFDFDKATIRADAKPALDRVAEILRSKSRGLVTIEGFTDSKGVADYNLRLSNARAESVAAWMIEREGLPRARFTTRGFGATRFVVSNTRADGSDDAAGRQKNRRVEIIVLKKD